MKLSTKTSLFYLLFSIPLFFFGSWLLFNGIKNSLQNEVDEELQNNKNILASYIDTLPANINIVDLKSPFIKIVRSDIYNAGSTFSDTMIYQAAEKEMVPYRLLTTYIKRDRQYYKVTSLYTLVETEDVIHSVIGLMCFVFIGLLLVFGLINFYINKIVWKPFQSTLGRINSLNMKELQDINFEKTSILEFATLNRSLTAMTKKIHADYLSMKTFTENASHEIQTPLAIIQSKLELLLQDTTLTGQQSTAIVSACEASQRLSKLNQTLLLIAKIENNQFEHQGYKSLKNVIEKYIQFFEEMMSAKQIDCQVEINEDWQMNVHPMLMDMLASNLLGNAIKYNLQKGLLAIELNRDSLVIRNTSYIGAINENALYKRFYKQEDAANGNGLGLSIVKEICEANDMDIHYSYADGVHQFTVSK